MCFWEENLIKTLLIGSMPYHLTVFLSIPFNKLTWFKWNIVKCRWRSLFLLNLNFEIFLFLHQSPAIFFKFHIFRSNFLKSMIFMGEWGLQFFDFLFRISESEKNYLCAVYKLFLLRSIHYSSIKPKAKREPIVINLHIFFCFWMEFDKLKPKMK